MAATSSGLRCARQGRRLPATPEPHVLYLPYVVYLSIRSFIYTYTYTYISLFRSMCLYANHCIHIHIGLHEKNLRKSWGWRTVNGCHAAMLLEKSGLLHLGCPGPGGDTSRRLIYPLGSQEVQMQENQKIWLQTPYQGLYVNGESIWTLSGCTPEISGSE